MIIRNNQATRAEYPSGLRAIMNMEQAEESRDWLSCWPMLSRGATPVWQLPGLARRLGVARISLKDESERSSLGSFKALGAPIALVRLILREKNGLPLSPKGLLLGRHADVLRDFTVISATDGNHGRALAAAAKDIGCRCVIVLHRNVSVEREQAIAAYGADIVRIEGDYDASVVAAAEHAAEHGWHVVSDTSYEGYETVPRDVMQGYGTIAAELLAQESVGYKATSPYSHVFLQGGVGGLAAGVVSYLWERFGAQRPAFIVVEPVQADCLFQSAIQGAPARATGSVDSVMAGLACGETSPLAWRFLAPAVDFFQTVTDDEAVAAMRLLAEGNAEDIPVVGGESGVAGLAGLLALSEDAELRGQVGLDASSSILLVNTEGATAPSIYASLIGGPAEAVLERQRAWLLGKRAT
ncbi:diaminopropionate ammonia-lyase [Noviherbaspirillum sp.]|uniref:diaminopropionate ammonia-lyase n=1 Tax=Noviherbaspirillum sp. TaxID=1926288 RepID=UPI002D52870F|nr:diaminopropionate ammonia-lyase [Noviherbaspirillum sp.]HZW20326.1 diaminopropionate ammonia-lyase [Noviherbaspirillum sp.]